MGPLWKNKPVSRAICTFPSGAPAREFSLHVPFTELPQRETLHLQSPFQRHLNMHGRWAHTRLPKWTPIKRDAYPQSLYFVNFRVPSKEAPFQVPLTAPMERGMPHFQRPLTTISQSSQLMDPMGWCPSPHPSLPYLSESPERICWGP